MITKKMDYVEIGEIKWATKCIGASSPYTYDAHLFQWGETTGHKEGVDPTAYYDYSWTNAPFNGGNSSYDSDAWEKYSNTVMSDNVLASSYDAATQLIGESPLEGYSWRMPTFDELDTLESHQLTLTNTTVKGVDGTEITIGSDEGVGTINGVIGMCFGNTTTSTDNILFLPFRGMGSDSKLDFFGHASGIWGASVEPLDATEYAWSLTFGRFGASFLGSLRSLGFCVLGVLGKE